MGLAALAAQCAGMAMPSVVCWLLAAFCTFMSIGALLIKNRFLSCWIAVVGLVLAIQGFVKFGHEKFLSEITEQAQQMTLRTEEVFAGYSPETNHIYATVLQAEDSAAVGAKVKLTVSAPVEPGELLQGSVSLSPLQNNPFAAAAKAEGIFLEGEGEGLNTVGLEPTIYSALRKLQKKMSACIKQYLNRDLGAIAAAVAVGDKGSLTKEVKTSFQQAGLSHLLVVSGMHLSIWASLWIALGRFLKLPPLGFGLAAVMSVGFALVTGFSASVIRALMVVLLYCVCGMLLRSADGLNSLGFAVFVMVVCNPFVCYDGSFWLSISATAGVLYGALAVRRTKLCRKKLCGHPMTTLQKICLWSMQAMAAPFFASLGTLPVLVCLGMNIAVFGVLANLAVGALLFPQLLFGWLCLLFGWIAPGGFFHRLFAFCLGLCSRLILGLAEWFSQRESASFYIQGIYPLFLMGIIAVIWAILWKLRYSRWLFAIVPIYLWIGNAISKALLSASVAVVLVGSRTSPCVVVFDRENAVVFFQGHHYNERAVEEFLEQRKLSLELLVDMRQAPKIQCQLQAEEFVSVGGVPKEGMPLEALQQKLSVSLYRQKQQGAMAALDLYGLTVAIPYGNGCWEEFPKSTFLVVGNAVPPDVSANWILTKQDNPWTRQSQRVISGNRPSVRIWPFKGIRLERDLK